MFYKILAITLIPGLLLAQKENVTIPMVPNITQMPAQQPQAPGGGGGAKQNTEVVAPPKTEADVPIAPENVSSDLSPDSHFFPHPGVIFEKNGRWMGDEHLYNLTNNIHVYVEVEKTKGLDVNIDKKKIKDTVAFAFKQSILIPINVVQNPPLPFFDVVVLIAPIDKGYAFYCTGRLFEAVTLSRVDFDKNVQFQAVTWEKQSLLIVPKDKLMDEILAAVKDIANSFVERYRYFEEIKQKKASENR